MDKFKNLIFPILVIGVFIYAITVSIIDDVTYKKLYKEQVILHNSLSDSLITWKNKDSLNVAKIKIIETESEETFLSLKNLEGINLELQNLIKSQSKTIDKLNAALIIKTETKLETIQRFYPIGGDTLIFSKSILLDSISNKWLDSKFGFINGYSYLNLNVKNQYNVTLGYEGKTLFKSGTPYATIINLNPYTSTSEMKVYRVSVPKIERHSIGINMGVGAHYDLIDKSIGVGPYIGLGYTYNIINW